MAPSLLIRLLFTAFSLSATTLITHAQTITTCPNRSQADYDFIIVGSGSGGGPLAARLAEANYRVLLVDTGNNVESVNNTIPAYFARSTDDPALTLNYTITEYPQGFKYQKTNWYPRARALGGTTNQNAMINVIAGTTPDFDPVAKWSGDSSWTRANMQKYYERLKEWMATSGLPLDVLALHPEYLDAQLNDALTNLGSTTDPTIDLNAAANDKYEGGANPSFTIDANHVRSGIRTRLLKVAAARPNNLKLQLNTLATRVLLCRNSTGGKPRAYGVRISPGVQLPGSGAFTGRQSVIVSRDVTAKYEVIVSAGTYQSPQLLMLSGIGKTSELQAVGINPLINLPGVGKNLQDHDEVTVIWHLKKSYAVFEGCKFLSDPAKDPCLKQWQADHANLYSFGSAINALTYKTPNRGLSDPDMFTFFGLVHSHGIIPGYPQMIADHPNALTAVILKAHSDTKGTVSLTGSHPQDRLNIFKNRFQGSKGPADVQDMREGIKRARAMVNQLPLSQHIETEYSPGTAVDTDAEIEDHIYKNIFAHHACCTNAMGPSSDPNAVINNNFQVYGVDGLRVVDMSSWGIVPGYFVATATYMISERAADVIIAATIASGI